MQKGPEIIIGLVGAVGTDLKAVVEQLSGELRRAAYTPHHIRLSQLIAQCDRFKSLKEMEGGPEDERIDAHMNAGDKLREVLQRGDAVALLAISRIRDIRHEYGKSSNESLPRSAYILNSLKHPREVDTLRRLYGHNFFLVSAYSPKSRRKERLKKLISKSRDEWDKSRFDIVADDLMEKDEKEAGTDLGQNVRDTFPEADYFTEAESGALPDQIGRFIDIVFGNPFVTPTMDEYGMFHAKAAALRSADLSRQVGAVIMTDRGEIVSAGCNEVPKAGGGAVWEGNPGDALADYRDFQVGHDASARMKHEIVSEIFGIMKANGWLSIETARKDLSQLVDEAIYSPDKAILKEARVANIIEFGRIVHAEMSAITEAARRGIGINNQTLYCTTFPCHMCARHIIASGLRRVIYIEPYPKSMAKELYERAISIDDDDADDSALKFDPFIGVAPRKYIAFFERGKRKDKKGYRLEWSAASSEPKFPDVFVTYVEAEAIHVAFLAENKDKLGMDDTVGLRLEQSHDPRVVGTADGGSQKAGGPVE